MVMIHSDEMLDDFSQKKRHNVETISPSSVFDKLTGELLIETLIRLPQKPANICKCISVRFRSLISTSYFVRRYLNHHKIKDDSFALYYHLEPKNRICRVFGSPIFESPGFSLSFLPELETIEYLASSNGLVLCCISECPPVVYFVCNPLTKQWITLPPPPTDVKAPYIGFICRNPQYLCNVNDDDDDDEQRRTSSFKVVRIPEVKSKSLPLEIFCSESGSWSKENYKPCSSSVRELVYSRNEGCPSAVVCGGLLHWGNLLKGDIFTYDPYYNGKCRSNVYPPGIRGSSFKCRLGESGGRLRYGKFCKDSKTYRVWELKGCSDSGEWFLLHQVHSDEMKSTVEGIDKDAMGLLPPHPLNQDIVFFWCRVSQRILEYNMRTKLLIKLPCFLQDAWNPCPMIPTFFPFVLPCWPTTIPLIEQCDES